MSGKETPCELGTWRLRMFVCDRLEACRGAARSTLLVIPEVLAQPRHIAQGPIYQHTLFSLPCRKWQLRLA